MIRRVAFNIKEFLTGDPVNKNLKELRDNFGKGKDLQERGFEKLSKHATQHTLYYKEYEGSKSLKDFPVITKQIIKENYDSFLSDKYNKEDLFKMTTSGSYGTPFTFYLNKEKKSKQHAEILFFGEWSNYFIGTKHAYLMTKSKSKVKLFVQNEIIMAPYTLDLDWLKKQRNILRQNKPKVLIGYTSAIVTLANFILSKNESFKLDGVITVSEVLSEDSREIIRRAFKVTPLSRYATQEFGVLANECKENNKHHLNDVNYIIEILKVDEDVNAAPGEVGRVVVTDLFSHAMPLIRYDTGDLAVLGKGECGCGIKSPYLELLSGRVIEEIYDVNGNTVSGFAINGTMQDIENVLQYQFSQENEKEYLLKMIILDDFNQEDKIQDRFKKFLGDEAKMKIEYVEEIPPKKSGKRPYVIQNYKSR